MYVTNAIATTSLTANDHHSPQLLPGHTAEDHLPRQTERPLVESASSGNMTRKEPVRFLADAKTDKRAILDTRVETLKEDAVVLARSGPVSLAQRE
jgi:hypothetical protein